MFLHVATVAPPESSILRWKVTKGSVVEFKDLMFRPLPKK